MCKQYSSVTAFCTVHVILAAVYRYFPKSLPGCTKFQHTASSKQGWIFTGMKILCAYACKIYAHRYKKFTRENKIEVMYGWQRINVMSEVQLLQKMYVYTGPFIHCLHFI